MKIIQNNTANNRFIYPFRLTCTNCHSILEVEQGDVKHSDGNEFINLSAHFYVQCPACSTHNTVKPQPIRDARSYDVPASNIGSQIAKVESQGQSDC
ncbi:CXXC-containing zinc-binding protein [Hymenobacter sp. GOD-10R]|uniref:CXXC-containing zinc-binding protein n=1 Tax=Hymenobacter sp. GOD-10R TaxID=3093922 RepID=UPI002D79478C|nr:DUF866 domain-containing protein [Hymenobacter sp. GOD-10R]WRQ26690.1 DUF866 domain-containing protein [Hymenobacter sp. GOD-10R]